MHASLAVLTSHLHYADAGQDGFDHLCHRWDLMLAQARFDLEVKKLSTTERKALEDEAWLLQAMLHSSSLLDTVGGLFAKQQQPCCLAHCWLPTRSLVILDVSLRKHVKSHALRPCLFQAVPCTIISEGLWIHFSHLAASWYFRHNQHFQPDNCLQMQGLSTGIWTIQCDQMQCYGWYPGYWLRGFCRLETRSDCDC